MYLADSLYHIASICLFCTSASILTVMAMLSSVEVVVLVLRRHQKRHGRSFLLDHESLLSPTCTPWLRRYPSPINGVLKELMSLPSVTSTSSNQPHFVAQSGRFTHVHNCHRPAWQVTTLKAVAFAVSHRALPLHPQHIVSTPKRFCAGYCNSRFLPTP